MLLITVKKITEEDKSDNSQTVHKFDTILKDIKNNGRTTKPLIIILDSNTNLYPLIIKSINARKLMLKKDYGLDKIFIFDEIDDSRYKLHMYNPRTSNMINRKNEMLEYLKIIELKLIDMLRLKNHQKELKK